MTLPFPIDPHYNPPPILWIPSGWFSPIEFVDTFRNCVKCRNPHYFNPRTWIPQHGPFLCIDCNLTLRRPDIEKDQGWVLDVTMNEGKANIYWTARCPLCRTFSFVNHAWRKRQKYLPKPCFRCRKMGRTLEDFDMYRRLMCKR